MRRNERGEMPKENINQTFVDNGADGKRTNTLHAAWGVRGDAPDAPDGWVNAGYVSLAIVMDPMNGENPDSDHYLHIEEADMDHIIRQLKRIRSKVWPD